MNQSDYVRVYQTWHLLKRTPNECASYVAQPATAPPQMELRHSVQMARVERGLSIHDLSVKVKCSPDTLSAFERGDDVLSGDLQKALRTVLNIEGKTRV